MYYKLEQKKSQLYVEVPVPNEISRGCVNSEFQFLDKKEISIELTDSYGSDFPDLIMAENYVPLISKKLKRYFDAWGIDNLFYKKIMLCMSDYEISEEYYLALPPRIDCLDPELSFDKKYGVCQKIVIISNRVGNYDIFKLVDGNDEIIITERLKKLLDDVIKTRALQGLIIKNI